MGQGDTLNQRPAPDDGAPLRRRGLLLAGVLGLAGCDAPPAALQGGFSGISHERGHLLRQPAPVQGAAPAAGRRVQVLIVGGGVAGLAAARRLSQSGIEDFALLELEDEFGGNSRSAMMAGMPCPTGAHYLPVPAEDGSELLGFLEQIGLRQRVAGRWVYDERHLCHSPQERLYFNDQWQEGLLPVSGVAGATLHQYRQFAARLQALGRQSRFGIPAGGAPMDAMSLALDSRTMQAWLEQERLDDPHLRWYLDYCCRDDYGAGLQEVSAWAALHYFASRHGFFAPEAGHLGSDAGLLTWPEGNAHLVRALADPLRERSGGRLHSGCVVTRVRQQRHEVEVDLYRPASAGTERWIARHCILALPMVAALRVVERAPELLRQATQQMAYAAWLVANIHVKTPLLDRAGAAPAWDNVLYGVATTQGGLGYVDAQHQRLDPTPGPTVLTHYRALGSGPRQRLALLQRGWGEWSGAILTELAQAHPDLPRKAVRMDITRYGHAMAVPGPGLQTFLRQALAGPQQKPSGVARLRAGQAALHTPVDGRLLFAHSDWSGYSIFEEAFARGDGAAALLV
jgi:glycine/D-amino acid oxidase-like deaminating enzyme